MKSIVIICLCFFVIPILQGQSIRLPAEWEPQERVHLAWFGHDRRDTVSCRVIKALQPVVAITLNIADSTKLSGIKLKLHSYAIDTTKVTFVYDPHTSYWTRDPLFFVFNQNKLNIVDFDYTMYGVYPDILGMPMPESKKKIGGYDQRLAKQLNIPTITSDFVFEGGGIETNGKGTFLIIQEMVLQRNPAKTLNDIEDELQRVLGAKKIIWLKEGLIEDRMFKNGGPFYKNYFGGGANRHIDELCRFVDENTVVLPIIPKKDIAKSPVDSINYYMLEDNLKILKKTTTAEGKKLNIHRVPMPEIEALKFHYVITESEATDFKEFGFNAGDTIFMIPAASYMNYFVSNEVVLIPKYWKLGMPKSQKQKDEHVKQVFKKMFPNRRVIQIYTQGINQGGGGIHCMTHEQPIVSNK